MNGRKLDYFELLNVDRRASPQEIKAAYHSRLREIHPDSLLNTPVSTLSSYDSETNLGNISQASRGELLCKIKEAYSILIDPVQRAQLSRDLFQQELYQTNLTSNNCITKEDKSDLTDTIVSIEDFIEDPQEEESICLSKDRSLIYYCRCGDYFSLSSQVFSTISINSNSQDNFQEHTSIRICCDSCSCNIKVINQPLNK